MLQVDIGHLSVHYGNPLEDQFQGHRVQGQPNFPAHVIAQQFAAYKHQMFLLRYHFVKSRLKLILVHLAFKL
jgi:hypothetical protein